MAYSRIITTPSMIEVTTGSGEWLSLEVRNGNDRLEIEMRDRQMILDREEALDYLVSLQNWIEQL